MARAGLVSFLEMIGSFDLIFALVQEEHPCPFPDCLETFVKSVHVKRHLTSNHGVANPLQWLEDQVRHLEDLE